jgi:hypothetical protein
MECTQGDAVLKITFAALLSCSIKKGERSYRTHRIASEELYSNTADVQYTPQGDWLFRNRDRSLPRTTVPVFWSFTTETFLQVITSEMVALVVLTAAVLMLAWYIRV